MPQSELYLVSEMAESPDADFIADTIEAALIRVEAILPGEAVDVFVDFRSGLPSPNRAGISGQIVFSTGSIQIWIDPETPPRRSLASVLPLLVAHEFHHSRRELEGAGYGTTLGEAMISEGLADWFASETFPEITDLPGSVTIPETEITELTNRVCSEFGDASYSFDEWFLGAGEMPWAAGYQVGTRLVRSFLEETEMTAGESVTIPAAEIESVAC